MSRKAKMHAGRIVLFDPYDFQTYPIAPVEPMPLTRPDQAPGYPARMPQQAPQRRTVTRTVTTTQTVTETRTETIMEETEPLAGYDQPGVWVRWIGPGNGGSAWLRPDGSLMSPAEIAQAKADIRSGRAGFHDLRPDVPMRERF